MRRLVFVLACLLLLPFALLRTVGAPLFPDPTPLVTDPAQLLEPGRHRLSLPIGGFDRKVIVVTPRNFKPGTPLPLVFFFHGAGGTALQASHTYGWAEKADVENFFVVFPEGMPVRPDGVASFLLTSGAMSGRECKSAASTTSISSRSFSSSSRPRYPSTPAAFTSPAFPTVPA